MGTPAEELQQIDARIVDLLTQQSELERLQRRGEQLAQERAAAHAELAAAHNALRDAEDDADALDEVSFSRLLHWVTDDRDIEVRRRRRRRAIATARAQDYGARVVSFDRQIAAVHGALKQLGENVAALDGLLDRKAALLRSLGDARVGDLDALDRRLGVALARRREIDEAQAAAHAAKRALDAVLAALESAHSWGTYDTWFGGGLISSAIKHDRIDEANDAARYAAEALARLRRELADVGTELTASIEMSDFLRFTDVWFDNFFSDITVQSRIKDGMRQADAAARAVAQSLHGLAEADRATEQELSALADARRVALLP